MKHKIWKSFKSVQLLELLMPSKVYINLKIEKNFQHFMNHDPRRGYSEFLFAVVKNPTWSIYDVFEELFLSSLNEL